MAMTFDHAGKEGAVGKIKHLTALRNIDFSQGGNGGDALTKDEDCFAALEVFAVEQAGGLQQHAACGVLGADAGAEEG